MPSDRDVLRDWHRLFGLLLTDFFTGSPFIVEVERDLSVQQQLLDVVIVRRGRGRFVGRLPDGLEKMVAHNLVTFKSHHEALDAWAMKELVGHYVAYRKFASPSPSELLPEDQFGLYAVAARFPQNLARQAPWRNVKSGVYDCQWGSDIIRVVVAGELSREPHNAPLHLFSASPTLVGIGSSVYRRRSGTASSLLNQLFERFEGEGLAMYTMEDFKRDYVLEHFPKLSPQERQVVLKTLPANERRQFMESLPASERRQFMESLPASERRQFMESLPASERRQLLESLPAEEILAVLSPEQIQQHLEKSSARRPAQARKARRRK